MIPYRDERRTTIGALGTQGVELTKTVFPGKMILSVVDQKYMDVTSPDQPGPPHRVTRC